MSRPRFLATVFRDKLIGAAELRSAGAAIATGIKTSEKGFIGGWRTEARFGRLRGASI